MSEFYNTKNKNIILDFFKNNSNNIYTASELIDILTEIPKATIYRKLEALVISKEIRKSYNDKLNCYEYQYSNNCSSHLHLKCDICGKTIHLKCEEANYLINHIKNSHGFEIDLSNSILYGICKECKK